MKNNCLPKKIKRATKSLRIYRLALISFFIVVGANASYGQTYSYEVWHDGQLVLDTGDTLTGVVKYDMMKDVVQFQHASGRNEAFSPRKLLLFQIDDKILNRNRTFFSLPIETDRGFEKLMFFEVLVQGKLTLFSRERIEIVQRSASIYGSYTNRSYESLEYDFYLLMKNKQIEQYDNSKSTLLAMMSPQSNDVKKYMKQKRLKVSNRRDLPQIVAYYNSIQ